MKLLSLIVVLSLAAIVPARQRRPRPASNSIRLSKGKPTVYIDFVRFGKREPRYTNESDQGVWLRVHNNTRWPLVFHGFGWFTRNDEEVTVFYGVEEIPKPRGAIRVSSRPPILQPPLVPPYEKPSVQEQVPESAKVENQDCEVSSGEWGIDIVAPISLPPGKSLIFSVPLETLCKNLKIYIVFNYAWEKHDEYRPFDDEPDHRAYFFGSDLPKISR